MENRPSWDEYFLTIAYIASQRSIDPSTKHGCVIVSEDNTILSIGYSSPPRGCDDENIPLTRPEKYEYMVHSEPNAIANAARNGTSIKNAIVYLTGMPCNRCFGELVNVGVKKIIIGNVGSAMVDESTLKVNDTINHDGRVKIINHPNPLSVIDYLNKTKEYIERKENEK